MTAARLGPSQHVWDTYPGYFLGSVWKLPPGDGALAQPQDYRAGWNLDHGVMGILVEQCQDRQKSMTACEEFQMVEDALSAGVGVRQPREGLAWVIIPAGSQLHTPYHNYSKLNHALAWALSSWMEAEASHGSCSWLTLCYFRHWTLQLTLVLDLNRYLWLPVICLPASV